MTRIFSAREVVPVSIITACHTLTLFTGVVSTIIVTQAVALKPVQSYAAPKRENELSQIAVAVGLARVPRERTALNTHLSVTFVPATANINQGAPDC